MEKTNEHPVKCEGSEPTNKPLSAKELLIIVLSWHIGVRTREQRAEDFNRANGLHVFLAAAAYFMLIVAGLILLVTYITH